MDTHLVNQPKVHIDKLDIQNVDSFFGEWVSSQEKQAEFAKSFATAYPYEHIVIDNFLSEQTAKNLSKGFPSPDKTWHKYYNPLEVKFALDDLEKMPKCHEEMFRVLCHPALTEIIAKICGIEDLEIDPFLVGAGLHAHPRFGRLAMHLDFEKNPISGKERRLNLILFLNNEWKPEWNGGLELWEKNMSKCGNKVVPKFNTAIIFRTNDISFHGLPEPILCPEGIFRQTLAFYWMSELTTKKNPAFYRSKAKFLPRPIDPQDERIKKLCEIRATRRITIDDMEQIFPHWEPKENLVQESLIQ